jgi:hypothetical protein
MDGWCAQAVSTWGIASNFSHRAGHDDGISWSQCPCGCPAGILGCANQGQGSLWEAQDLPLRPGLVVDHPSWGTPTRVPTRGREQNKNPLPQMQGGGLG